jgi:hypothetical protein
MTVICEFCNKEFSSVSSLNYHKKTTKYCLKLQDVEKSNLYSCEFCNKNFNLKYHYISHSNNCKDKKEKYKIEKENELNNLKDIFEKYKIEKENELNILKDIFEKYKIEKENELNILKDIFEKYKIEKEKLILEIENKNLRDKLNDEKNRVDKLIDKTTTKTTTNIQNNKIQINKDDLEEMFEKLPKFTHENIVNSLKDNLNEDIILAGLPTFSKVVNTNLGEYGIVTDFSRNKVIIKDKNGNKVKTITPKILKVGINTIEPILNDLLKNSREKVETFNILDQDVYISNMFPIKELMIACKNGRLSDKELNKCAKSLTKNCNFPSASSTFVPISDLRSEREALRSDKSERNENYIESTDNIENELQELESVSEENDTMLELETFED